MSHFSSYLKERENKDIIETQNGFATYKIFDNGECYIQDIYIVPDKRKSGIAATLADQIVEKAKQQDCHTLIGSVCSDANDATMNLKVLLGYNMQLYKVVGNMIFFKKDISGVE